VLNLVGKDKGYVLEWFRNSFLGAISLEVELVGNWVLLFFCYLMAEEDISFILFLLFVPSIPCYFFPAFEILL